MSHYEHLLYELARNYGLADGYHAVDGSFVHGTAETRRRLLAAFGVQARDFHEAQLALAQDHHREPPRMELKAAHRCHIPFWLEQAPAWGITLQLYELHSRRSWGIGDLADLAQICRIAGREGADFVGLTPLSALFVFAPERASPFSPSNRRFLNPLFIAVDAIHGFVDDMVPQVRLAEARESAMVDYTSVATLKLEVLARIWAHWKQNATIFAGELTAFDHWRNEGGQALERHALFEAISEAMVAQGRKAGWTDWPAELQHPGTQAVADFARRHGDRVSFHAWLQWIADCQLGEAQSIAVEAGMRIGLYVDLAVGEAPDGSALWSAREDYVGDATVGAPPDWFSSDGQEWGIVALSPVALERNASNPFRELVDAVTRHAGALRIDHVMALWQLFLIPEGLPPSMGLHVRYNIDRLVDQLADLSRDRQFIVIGEDLGHVPPGFREIMRDSSIFSYRILYFEELGPTTLRDAASAREALACISSHDLPTLAGWWQGDDIDLRLQYGLIRAEEAESQREAREAEREALLAAARPDDCLTVPKTMDDGLAASIHRFLAGGRSLLAAVRLADLAGEIEPTNLPGTNLQYPNWRRKCPLPIEELEASPRLSAILPAMRDVRPRP